MKTPGSFWGNNPIEISHNRDNIEHHIAKSVICNNTIRQSFIMKCYILLYTLIHL